MRSSSARGTMSLVFPFVVTLALPLPLLFPPPLPLPSLAVILKAEFTSAVADDRASHAVPALRHCPHPGPDEGAVQRSYVVSERTMSTKLCVCSTHLLITTPGTGTPVAGPPSSWLVVAGRLPSASCIQPETVAAHIACLVTLDFALPAGQAASPTAASLDGGSSSGVKVVAHSVCGVFEMLYSS